MDFIIEDDDSGGMYNYTTPATKATSSDPYDFAIEDDLTTYAPKSALSQLGATTRKTGFGAKRGSSWDKSTKGKAKADSATAKRASATEVTGKADYFLNKYKQGQSATRKPRFSADSSFEDTTTSVDISESDVASPSKQVAMGIKSSTSSAPATMPAATAASQPQSAPKFESFGRVMNIADLLSTVNEPSEVSEASVVFEELDTQPAVAVRPATKKSTKFSVNTRIMARYRNGPDWYAGRILSANSDGTYAVEYDDGDEEDGVFEANIELYEDVRPVIPSATSSVEPSRYANADSPSLLGKSASVYSMQYDYEEEQPVAAGGRVLQDVEDSVAESIPDDTFTQQIAQKPVYVPSVANLAPSPLKDDYSYDFETTQNASSIGMVSPGNRVAAVTPAAPPASTISAQLKPSILRAPASTQAAASSIMPATLKEAPRAEEEVKMQRKAGQREVAVQTDENFAPSTSAPYGGFQPSMPPGYPAPPFAYGYPPYSPYGYMPAYGYPAPYGCMPPPPPMPYGAGAYAPPFSAPNFASSPAANSVYLKTFSETLNRLEGASVADDLPRGETSRRTSFSAASGSDGTAFPATRSVEPVGGLGGSSMAWTAAPPPSASLPLPVPPSLAQHPAVVKALSKYRAAMSASDAMFEKQLGQLRESLHKNKLLQASQSINAFGQSLGSTTSHYTPTLAETKVQIAQLRQSQRPPIDLESARKLVAQEMSSKGT